FCGSVCVNSVNGNLHFLKPGLVQLFDEIAAQQETIRYHPGPKETEFSACANQVWKVWVQRRFSARKGDAKSAQTPQLLQSVLQDINGNGIADLIVFGAIAA